MKKVMICAIGMLSLNVAWAAPAPQEVSLPVKHERINCKKHEGLVFQYDLTEKPAKRVVCHLTNVYKGWLEFSYEGVRRESGVYGDYETVRLVNRDRRGPDEFRVDPVGKVTVNDVPKEGVKSYATCHYEADR